MRNKSGRNSNYFVNFMCKCRDNSGAEQCAGMRSLKDETAGHSRRFRIIAWANIACQLMFPLALSFTPLMTAAETEKHVPAGDPLPDLGGSVVADTKGGSGTGTNADSAASGAQAPDSMLNATQKLWGVLGSSSPRERGVEMATGYASGVANQAVQDWLSQYGNARFSFSTQGTGSADLLLPLMDTSDYLLYTQAGMRRGDDRTTGNFGLGGRFFTPDWMFGVNAFYDNDFTGNNRRLGLGVEAWRDYLKLSANSYMRLSDWRQSPLHESRYYDERPANGFDVRAEGWLPAWPQLGGKLMYEHYQGKDVALSGDFNSRRNNPSAVTAGLSYTPFPLLKVGVEHREGSGTGDTTLNLDFSYRFGVPWSEQINPQRVGAIRTMAGTRYDLADRNYDIVLQYRKQELISLSIGADKNPGYTGESVTLTATARSKYGLARVDWSAPELLAAGGALTPVAKDGSVVRVDLPSVVSPKAPLRARKVTAGDPFIIEGVAYDREGNEARATLELNVVRSTRGITARLVGNRAAADGRMVNTVEVEATDSDTQLPLPGEEVELVFTYADGPEKGKVLDTQTVKTDEQGKAVAEVSSRLAARVSVAVRLKSNGNSTGIDDMAFVADNATAKPGEPVVDVAEAGRAVADGRGGVTLTFPVTDANGNPVTGQEVTITTTNGAKPERVVVTTDEQGNAAITVTSTVAGVSTVTATVNGVSQGQDVTFEPGAPDTTQTVFTVTPGTLVADGIQSAALSLALKDGAGNRIALSGDDVSFNVSGPDGVALSAVTCGEDVCTATLRGSLAGTVTLTPVVKGVSMSAFARTVTLTAESESAQGSKLTVKNNTVPADDITASVVEVKVENADGSPAANVRVEFSADAPAHFLKTDYATSSEGIASASLVSPLALETHVTAIVNGNSINSETIRFVAVGSDAVFDGAQNVTLPDAVTAGTITPVIFTVRDSDGKPLSGQPVKVSYFVPGGVSGATVVEDTLVSGSDGRVSVSAGSNKAGPMNIVAEINGNRQTVTVNVEADSANPAKDGEAGGTTFRAEPSVLLLGERTTLTLVLKDRYGNAIAGRNDIELSDGSRFTETGVPGTWTASLDVKPDAAPGVQTVTVLAGALQVGELSLTVTDGALPGDTGADLVIKENDHVADGVAEDVLALTLADVKNGDVAVSFSVEPASGTVISTGGGAVITPTGGNTVDGSLEATVTSKTAGDFIVKAELAGGKTISKTVTFVADTRTATFGNNPHLTDITATVGNPATVSFMVQDANGNLIKNQPVTITADNGATPSSVTVTTGADGVASVTVSNDTAGETTVTATVNGQSQDARVTFSADEEHPAGIGASGGSVLTAPKELVAGEPATVTLELKDEKGNAITGRTDITLSDGTRFTETAPGKYEATLQEDSVAGGNKDVSVLAGGTPLAGSVMNIPVKAGEPDTAKSTLSIQPDTILADGKATATVSLTMRDGKGNPVTGKEADIKLALTKSPSTADGITLSGISEDAGNPGTYTATVSGTVPGEAEVTASVGGSAFKGSVTLTPDESTASVTGISVKETSVPADGKTTNTLTATVVDTNGRPVQGVTVDWSKNQGVNASLAGNTSTTNEKGEATMEVTGTAAETAKFGARVGANTSDTGKEADAVFDLYPVISSMVVTKDNVPADGSTASTVEVVVSDAAGNVLDGATVSVTASGTAILSPSTGTTSPDGKVTFSVTDTTAETPDVTATVGGGFDRQKSTVSPVFGQYVKFDGLTLTHTPPTTDATAAGKICQADCDITLTAKVVDVSGNAVPDVSVSFQGSVTGNDGSVVTSGADGMVSVTRKYDKGGVEDVSLVASSQGATIGASAANKIDILRTITRRAVHADPTGPMLRSSLTYMGPKTPVNSYPTDLDPELAKAGSYRCTATATYTYTPAMSSGRKPHILTIQANGKTEGTNCQFGDSVPQEYLGTGVSTNPANIAAYWPVPGCQNDNGNYCGVEVRANGQVSLDIFESWLHEAGAGIFTVAVPAASSDSISSLIAYINGLKGVPGAADKLSVPGALVVTVSPGVVHQDLPPVNGPLFTDVP
ncbi:hypothetical protein EAP48_02635 [Salmonella enterica]|nr:hypothetical protein [Salmonella enterica]EAS6350934.1 hypothetical protein [Salmonella enterica]